MCAGAAASLIGIVISLVTIGATKTAIEKHSPNLSASQVNSTQHALIAGFVAGGVIAAAVWILLARASGAAAAGPGSRGRCCSAWPPWIPSSG